MSEYVYKYRAFSKLHLQALLENKIWFSKSETFNDPFDSSHHTFLNKSDLHSMFRLMQQREPHNSHYYEGLINSVPNQVMHFESQRLTENGELESSTIEKELPFKSMSNILSNAYIFCACTSGTNNLMWSHYGDYHKGFCIRYKKAELEKLNLYKHKKVEYVSNRTNVANVLNNGSDITQSVIDQSFVKGIDWEYEKEYRFLMLADESFKEYSPSSVPVEHDVSAVDMIIFGLKTPDSDKVFIRSLLAGRDVKFKDVKVSETGFGIHIQP
ncbi:DUF2971 domain-containing protein [Vibrio parahaemolyticus]|uniref:DUF2971 domain-containing protein n=2 Tax=Vibrio parahaemolyticus TaxID=670 RepID=UPI001121FBD7|nr:DUF2971 domain-containing protein [Vibrio parahaemolyticus]HDY7479593.1 DUF2971 domain-containing protein [Vibrio vulnificus]EGQ9824034.1 DUF2971 domain-containing protein [Vibrio parahaemolyticus]EGR0905755.1 DUF2971 domain-containing protein [Vibrio parahaemolyticus]EJL7824595.1 DUF2971 domain-containing protein [Vibrio parahaemolyticus]MUT58927.1 DUF2971 domain-containing protein [Vibrio parahaemolyticus]